MAVEAAQQAEHKFMQAQAEQRRIRELDLQQARYDASTGAKEQFSYLDLGLNPEAKLPTNTGRIVWMAPGAVTIGLGDNTGWGGSNVSSFGLSAPITAATLTADGKTLIKDGVPQ